MKYKIERSGDGWFRAYGSSSGNWVTLEYEHGITKSREQSYHSLREAEEAIGKHKQRMLDEAVTVVYYGDGSDLNPSQKKPFFHVG